MTMQILAGARTGVAVALTALLLGACSSDSSAPDAASARVRLLNGSSATVDLLADGQVIAGNVSAGGASPFAALSAGGHKLTLMIGGETRGEIATTLGDSTDYAVVTGGDDQSLSAVVQPDTALGNPGTSLDGKIKLWVVYADSSGKHDPLDVYLTAPDADLTTATPLANSLDFGFVPLDPGTYQVRFTEAGTTNVVLDSGPLVLDAETVESLILTQGNDGPFFRIMPR